MLITRAADSGMVAGEAQGPISRRSGSRTIPQAKRETSACTERNSKDVTDSAFNGGGPTINTPRSISGVGKKWQANARGIGDGLRAEHRSGRNGQGPLWVGRTGRRWKYKEGAYRSDQMRNHDLEVPVSSEIVIEGEFNSGVTEPEGPFGEFTGYMTSSPRGEPVFKARGITFRNEPILQGTLSEMPPSESSVRRQVMGEGAIGTISLKN